MKTKYQVLILEDDPVIVEQLAGFLEQTGLFDHPFICTNTMQAISVLRQHFVDLMILDMVLPDVHSFELLKLFPQRSPTIAISAHPQYAVDCYDLEVKDFLTKPLSFGRFLRALRRAIFQFDIPNAVLPQYVPDQAVSQSSVVPLVTSDALTSPYVYLKVGRKNERFRFSDILYFKGYSIYSKLISKTGQVVVTEQLSQLDSQLSTNQFIRVHKSFLINLDHVTQFSTKMIWLGSHKIPIGATYKAKVQYRLDQLNKAGSII